MLLSRRFDAVFAAIAAIFFRLFSPCFHYFAPDTPALIFQLRLVAFRFRRQY